MKKPMLLLAFIGAACLLNSCGGGGGGTQIGVATHSSVTTPAAVSIGEFFNITVTALDSQNNLVPSYSGVVLFTRRAAPIATIGLLELTERRKLGRINASFIYEGAAGVTWPLGGGILGSRRAPYSNASRREIMK